MALPGFVTVNAYEYSVNGLEKAEVKVSAEYPVTLKINDNPYVSIASSGLEMELFAIGHLISDGVITCYDDIKEIQIDEEKLEININLEMNDDIIERLFRIRSIASGCGQGPTTIDKGPNYIKIDENVIIKGNSVIPCMNEFLKSSSHHKLTRGVHSAALYDSSWNKIVFLDEIGRHNAIDKIIGYSYKNNISVRDKIILSTGRLSSEIVSKAINVSLPVVISKASPTSFSVELARKHGLLLIGKMSGSKFVIFNGEERVKN